MITLLTKSGCKGILGITKLEIILSVLISISLTNSEVVKTITNQPIKLPTGTPK
jgi:hypothetical protein